MLIGEEEEKEGVNPFLPGDLVQVISGDLRNLVARVVRYALDYGCDDDNDDH